MVISSGEIKIIGDDYAGNYSCGLSMLGSGTAERMHETREDIFGGSTNAENGTVSRGIIVKNESEDGLLLLSENVESDQSEATEVVTSFINNTEKEVTLEYMTSFKLKDIPADKIYRLESFWSAEGRVKFDELVDLNMEHSWSNHGYRVEKFGNVGTMPVRKYFPFLALEDTKTGKFIGIEMYAPCSWQIEILVKTGDVVTVAGGIADRDFGQWTKKVAAGESFTAPRALIAEGTSLEDVCDKLVRAQKPHISPVDDHMGIVFNEYCTTWGEPTIENLKKIADKLEGKGIQYLVMDSGWYADDNGQWWENRGDWSINKKRFPNGLKELADYVRSKGMIPGIWFEPEVVSPLAPAYAETDHVVKKDGFPLSVASTRFWDMEDKWVKEYLKKNVIDNLKENGFGYIKVDYNDTMGIGCDGPDSMGENLRNKVQGSLDFFERMVKEIPELVIENCSSGGHRLEPAFMEKASMASFSDAHETLSLPIIAANVQRVIRPEQSQIWAVMRKEDSDERIFYSMCATFLGRMGLSGDIYDMNDHQWQLIDEAISYYKEIADIIKNGKTIVIKAETKSYNKPTGGQLVIRSYESRSLLIYHRFEASVSMEEFAENNRIKIPEGKIISKYGDAHCDFSAQAIVVDENA
ncbi:glycoside hydrolase family 36 protein [Butyrivibrio sp. YAB3001]|uniref:glycoside hydrolase family 36 protein n=1 Tax=Butyrivibrio sp. YAB3001 TaxID=1520812 RepID=UPI0008F6183F|nr:glycoside hydrolase family 36 protein [Butyrivibrio sp. YAB3001]SFC34993.1 alpha-galactosidase [Butyrivibrio sp. YAB3001]